jgi:hypothetical protein
MLFHESVYFQCIDQFVETGRIDATTEPHGARFHFKGRPFSAFQAFRETGSYGGIQDFLKRLALAMHGFTHHQLNIFIERNRRSHNGIMMPL